MSLKLGNINIAGAQVLYSTTGNNIDGAMTQAITTTQLNLKANDANVVHKTGNETVAGVKTFASGSPTSLITKSDKIDSDIKPSSTQYSNFIDGYDVNGKLISRIFTRKESNGRNGIAIQAWNGSTNYVLGVNSDGTSEAPTPSAGDNSTKIATTAYINTKFQVVSTFPANPDSNVYYFIPE